jgi:hypothetical protein
MLLGEDPLSQPLKSFGSGRFVQGRLKSTDKAKLRCSPPRIGLHELQNQTKVFLRRHRFDKAMNSRRFKNQIKVFSAAHIKSSASAHARVDARIKNQTKAFLRRHHVR